MDGWIIMIYNYNDIIVIKFIKYRYHVCIKY